VVERTERWWQTGPQPEYTEKVLVQYLQRLARKLVRTPRFVDAVGRKPSADQYVKCFGSWREALKRADLVPNRKHPYKLTAEQRAEIKRRYVPPSPGNAHDLALEFGVTAIRVSQIGRAA
jgi:hypothetical protein